MPKLTNFSINGSDLLVRYKETQQVKEGVECDIYEFIDDTTRDLAIIRVKAGYKTPLQKVLKGKITIEGFLDGRATLTITSSKTGSIPKIYSFDSKQDVGKEVMVLVGETMQWSADTQTGLTFYEICTPPYKDGRFKNLPE